MHTQTKALTGTNYTTALHRGSLAFMVSELIIEELSIASAGTDELKTVESLGSFSDILYNIKSGSVLSISTSSKKYHQ